MLTLHPAGAEAELDSSAGDVVCSSDRVGENGRVAKRHRGDERSEPERRSPCGEAGDDRPRVVHDVGELVVLEM